MSDNTSKYDELIDHLDLPAKVRLLTGETMFTVPGEESIGLAPLSFSDGPTGVRGLVFSGGPLTTLLPNATLLASAWSEDTAYVVGSVLAEEAERQHIHVVLGPTINLHRTPLGGRLFEAYSEDPLLTGRLAAAYVRGLQERGVGACLKHLVANESETERHTVNSVVDERTMRELYLLPFEIAVHDSHPWSIMAAYNNVNGVAATEQDEINNRVVKDEWGWDGLLMSDWYATQSTAPAANGGLDLVMPGPAGPWGDALVAAVEEGDVTMPTINDHVRRLLRLADRAGALGTHRTWSPDSPEPTDAVRRELMLSLAAAGMTVLTNDGALPLQPDQTVALIGRLALETTCMGGGSAVVRAPHQISVSEGLRARREHVSVTDGVSVRVRPRAASPSQVADPVLRTPGMRLQLWGQTGTLIKDVHLDEAYSLVGQDDDLPEPAARAVLSAIVPAGAMRLGVIGVGEWAVECGELSAGVTLATETHDVGEAILRPPGWQTDVVLAEATLLTATLTPAGITGVGLVVEPTPVTDEKAIEAAVAAARTSDVAVVVVGLTEEQETEAVDKTTLVLPGRQDELVTAVAAVARRTVVVINAATPVLMPWAAEVDAILVAGIPGQEGGHAVAAALLNEIEPSGRLVTSWPVADAATPAWGVTPTEGDLVYDEGVFIGYRGHAAGLAAEPAFWFGHGLGYGEWSYGPATVTNHTVTLEITNTSAIDSREVVQVYYDPLADGQPIRLAGWATAQVRAGQRATVQVVCDERMWRTWDVDSGGWHRLSSGELVIARGLADVRQRIPW